MPRKPPPPPKEAAERLIASHEAHRAARVRYVDTEPGSDEEADAWEAYEAARRLCDADSSVFGEAVARDLLRALARIEELTAQQPALDAQ